MVQWFLWFELSGIKLDQRIKIQDSSTITGSNPPTKAWNSTFFVPNQGEKEGILGYAGKWLSQKILIKMNYMDCSPVWKYLEIDWLVEKLLLVFVF